MNETNEITTETEEIFRQEVQARKDGNAEVIPIPAALRKMQFFRGKRFVWVVTRKGYTIDSKLEIIKE